MRSDSRELVLLFPGQGVQHARMAAGLYRHDPVFTETVDDVLERFGDAERMRADWLSERPSTPVDDVALAQPLLFTTGYALGRMLLDGGVRPAALLGHSVGELVAATLAGVFDLGDAVTLMRDRVARLRATPPGGMLTVSATAHDLAPVLARHPQVAVGAVNAPRQIALAGLDGPLEAAERDLRAAGFTVRRVAATTAFHSPVLAPLFTDPRPLPDFRLGRPRIPLWSAFTTEPVTAPDPAMWADQPAAPVLFWPTLDKLLRTGRYLLADVGPGQGLATPARRHPEVQAGRSAVTALLPARPGPPEAERAAVQRFLRVLQDEGLPAPRPTLSLVAAHTRGVL
ncbi:polyketide synthase [Streptomyces solincola]|uniref:Polyketide synthase n=1 Tax=Streptomyces solincola TaxID=2100817 RepID=A0A2S9Q1I5_9ACTN|nr:acyltransferase domain-containing protein [Streptomyces solincola]PRH80473.1 polyketide synthase [Streptomyces solincola]